MLFAASRLIRKVLRSQSFPKTLALVREYDAGDLQDVLDQYRDTLGVNSIIFGSVKEVFFDRFQTREADSTSNEAVDIVMKELVNSVSRCLKDAKREENFERHGKDKDKIELE
ncbi:hypothetical protein BGZ99_007155 [Dissophora globulifera]|uniref:Uncharacterized protein n=1 Tax=Dissophora globulifera TaxID=979702 RepID=A0A9P6URE0_9FUNG|nr:hypothetical protein BGZ99_007155 [Dissophora globulifera]